MDAYKQYDHLVKCHTPEFTSDASEFHVTLWNLNYGKEFANKDERFANDRKEFLKASRQIYNLISANPHITTTQMAEKLKLSQRQVQKYLKRLQDAEKISRSGSRKNSEWKIIDEEYEGLFDRI